MLPCLLTHDDIAMNVSPYLILGDDILQYSDEHGHVQSSESKVEGTGFS